MVGPCVARVTTWTVRLQKLAVAGNRRSCCVVLQQPLALVCCCSLPSFCRDDSFPTVVVDAIIQRDGDTMALAVLESSFWALRQTRAARAGTRLTRLLSPPHHREEIGHMAGVGHVSPSFLSVFRRCPTFGAISSYDPSAVVLLAVVFCVVFVLVVSPSSYLLFGRALLVGLSWSWVVRVVGDCSQVGPHASEQRRRWTVSAAFCEHVVGGRACGVTHTIHQGEGGEQGPIEVEDQEAHSRKPARVWRKS